MEKHKMVIIRQEATNISRIEKKRSSQIPNEELKKVSLDMYNQPCS